MDKFLENVEYEYLLLESYLGLGILSDLLEKSISEGK
jgi:hypothetical protein